MRIVETKDGSPTFYNEEAKQCYHSVSGAIEEALEKHVKPCNIEKLAENKEITILDVCFGMGYNSAVAIDVIKNINPNCKINIIAIEYDLKVLNDSLSLNPDIKSYNIIKKAIKKEPIEDNINITIYIEDLKTALDKIETKVDAVFFDPFSPKAAPDLWEEEIFKKILNLMNKGARLTTYSCSSRIRINMARAGLKPIDGPCVGRRAPSTIAIK